jgi:hypothetical protein
MQLDHELLRALGRDVERKQFDRNRTVGIRIVRAEDRPERAGADLMKNSKPPERVRGRSARRVGVQRGLLQERACSPIVTRKLGRNLERGRGVLVLSHQSNSACPRA